MDAGPMEGAFVPQLGDKKALPWQPAYLAELVDHVEKILIARQADVFICDGRLVTPLSRPRPAASIWHARGQEMPQETTAWELFHLSPGALQVRLNRYMYFYNDDKTNKSVDVPRSVLAGLLSPDMKKTKLPLLNGISSVPYLFADGAISEPGYDKDLNLLFYYDWQSLLAWPEQPTIDDARAALGYLKWLVREFPFEGPVDRGVAICAFLTAVVRRSYATAPMIGLSAPIRGSGKSLLTDMIAIAATGTKMPIINYGNNQEEFEKRIDTILLAGTPMVSIDNVENQGLRTATLCSYLTGSDVNIRKFGTNDNYRAIPSTMFFINGNNLTISDDLDRRMLLCVLDPGVERPELLPHSFDPIVLCRESRDRIVQEVFTVLRAYIFAGNPLGKRYNLGGFEDWCDHVVAALMWAADGDKEVGNPLDSVERVRTENPVIAFEREFKQIWYDEFQDRPLLASELLVPAFKDKPIHRALRDLVGAKGGELSAKSLGWKLKEIKGRPHGGYKLVEYDRKKNSIRWQVIYELQK